VKPTNPHCDGGFHPPYNGLTGLLEQTLGAVLRAGPDAELANLQSTRIPDPTDAKYRFTPGSRGAPSIVH
jgi:hypothetical protein